MTSPALYYRSGAPLGEIILNQPAKRNAISAAMWAALKDAVAEAEADAGARLIVLRGEGEHFAAGADISEFEAVYKTRDSAERYTRAMLESLAALEGASKPTLAAIRGSCVGGGCSIALACDFRYAETSARFGVTPGKLGLVYSLEDTRRLVRAVGVGAAKDLLMTGRLIDSAEARLIGLVDALAEESSVEAHAAMLAGDIAALSQWSVKATKQMFRLLMNGAADGSDKAMALMLEAFDGPDFKEGYKAFLEKRRPVFPVK